MVGRGVRMNSLWTGKERGSWNGGLMSSGWWLGGFVGYEDLVQGGGLGLGKMSRKQQHQADQRLDFSGCWNSTSIDSSPVELG
ncbi:hypothetical protein KSP39_PZI017138 [Platanthera zijinensis]|uniref:Uncharacterized protein n=1 Tax=Platanthera zijinensis TaxID=2320716 RepID=A0AAP0G0H3_9ASPA